MRKSEASSSGSENGRTDVSKIGVSSASSVLVELSRSEKQQLVSRRKMNGPKVDINACVFVSTLVRMCVPMCMDGRRSGSASTTPDRSATRARIMGVVAAMRGPIREGTAAGVWVSRENACARSCSRSRSLPVCSSVRDEAAHLLSTLPQFSLQNFSYFVRRAGAVWLIVPCTASVQNSVVIYAERADAARGHGPRAAAIIIMAGPCVLLCALFVSSISNGGKMREGIIREAQAVCMYLFVPSMVVGGGG